MLPTKYKRAYLTNNQYLSYAFFVMEGARQHALSKFVLQAVELCMSLLGGAHTSWKRQLKIKN